MHFMSRPKIERVYYENGRKITRYEPREAKGARDMRAWSQNRLHNGWALIGASPESCEPLDPSGHQVIYASFSSKCIRCGAKATHAFKLDRFCRPIFPHCDACWDLLPPYE